MGIKDTDRFETHVQDTVTQGEVYLEEDNDLVTGPQHVDPHSELSPNEVAELEDESSDKDD